MYVYIMLLKNVNNFLYIYMIRLNIFIFRAKFNINYQLSNFPILEQYHNIEIFNSLYK